MGTVGVDALPRRYSVYATIADKEKGCQQTSDGEVISYTCANELNY